LLAWKWRPSFASFAAVSQSHANHQLGVAWFLEEQTPAAAKVNQVRKSMELDVKCWQ